MPQLDAPTAIQPVFDESLTTSAAPPMLGLSALVRAAFHEEDISVHAGGLLERMNAADPYAMLDLSLVLQLCYQKKSGLDVLNTALKFRQIFRIATGGAGAVRLLVIKTPGDLMANTPLECMLENAGFTIDVLYVGPDLPWPSRLPPHDVVFVAVGEADSHVETLARLATYLRDWPRPVLNLPQRITHLSRAEAFKVLADVPGLCMAPTHRIDRPTLQQIAAGNIALEHVLADLRFPVIVRPQGAHAGIHLARIDTAADIAPYLQQVEGGQFFIANFMDYASPDGVFRKFRVVMIEGKPFLAHMGISQHWMVHYPYPEMKADPARRTEEAAAMAGFDSDFARRHAATLNGIAQHIGLDYFGFDCAEMPNGDLLVFELSNALIIHAMDDTTLFPYKIPQMRKIFGAFQDMVRRKALAASAAVLAGS
ncbi:hypothetical protein K2X14_04835 [Acetobacter sp. TBRC 12305]|uniref:ATP-grasp domain-containing protein n=1 Tax=Acetobacter garciniae TaxID=2817435 RepID=A0A939HMP9_9PROT|nr:hypothetical protein [Acetobacter garciniae]MBO1324479.1 hypothetical protein [Acetobacter garciniae]MBX0344168.1 hypothetical protein [Acetobacter garciniae]